MTSRPPAELERRLHGFAVDRALVWGAAAAAGLLAGASGRAMVAVPAALVLAAGLLAVLLGRTGSTPGHALAGVRVVRDADGGPLGVPAALLRQLAVETAALPTLGLGAAALAWSAAADPSGRRRGWHDRLAGSIALDIRRRPVAAPEPEPELPGVVNLTALRLAPGSAVPPATVVRPSPGPAGPAPAPPRWRVGFDSGESLVVEELVLVGRGPEPRADERPGRLLPLPSSDLSLSKTHAQLQVAADGALVVMDRGSTNGSLLIRQGVARSLPAGRATTLLDGDRLRLGDREMRVAREP